MPSLNETDDLIRREAYKVFWYQDQRL